MNGYCRLSAGLAAAVLSGCAFFSPVADLGPFDATEVFEVTPATGVWDGEYGSTSDPANCSFSFRLIREREGVVVEATVLDDVIVADSCRPGSDSCPSWDDDTFQCFFDGDCDKSPDVRAKKGRVYGGEYTLVANGASQSDFSGCPKSFGRAWKGKVEVTAKGARAFELNYRLWFSWEAIGFITPPKDEEDVIFGFNACVHDDDTGGRADRALYWKGTPVMPYRDESHFAIITLKGRSNK